jgi:hypothetical protein
MPRLVKQLLYGLLYVVIFIGLPVGMYFSLLKPAPTCWDGVQNGKEEGIDCGGGCPQVCIPKDIRALEAGEVKALSLGRDENGFMHESFFVEVTNPNVEFAARRVHFTITTETASATATLARLDGTTYFYAGEVRTLAFPNIIVGEHEVVNASIAFFNPEWVPAEAWKRPQLRVQHAATRRDSENGEIIVEGELVNDDSITFPTVEVLALLRGRLGEIAGVSRTELAEVAPGVPRAFRILHPNKGEIDEKGTSVVLSAGRP